MAIIDKIQIGGELKDVADAQARRDIGLLDKYGAQNRTPWVDGEGWTSTLRVACNGGVYTANGTLAGNAETHYNIFSSTDALPDGITPGMDLQVTHECKSENVTFRLYNRVNDTNVMLAEIPGNGTKNVTVDENATGMIVRLSYKNGNTYANMVSKPYILGTLTKQETKSNLDSIKYSAFFAKGEIKSGLSVSYRTGVISVNGSKSDTQTVFFTIQPEGAKYASRMIEPTGNIGGAPNIPLKQGHKYALRGTFPTNLLLTYTVTLLYKNSSTDETWQKISISSSTSSAPVETPAISFDHMGKLFLSVVRTTSTSVSDTINFVLEDVVEV